MGTVSDKLTYLQGTKSAIKDAIVAKGVSIGTETPFRAYATKIREISLDGTPPPVADEWVRPTEWLPLPDNVDGVQKVSILNAVFDTDSEFVAFICQGNYTIDWGDGVTENFATGVKAEHKYNYSDVGLNSDTVATFGYKQCIITITPQSGQNLTVVSFGTYHSSIGSVSSYDLATGFLDIRVNSLFCVNLIIGAASNPVRHTMLEQCIIGELADKTLNELFYDCYSLQSVSIKDTSNVTSFASMHYNNYSLQKMPTYTFNSAGVDVNSMFFNCYSLIETHPISLTLKGFLYNMFYYCKSLKSIDLTINSNVNYPLSSVFNGCLSLENILLSFTGTGKLTNIVNTFVGTRIKESPALDTSLCTSFANAFQNCDRLTDLYEYDYTSATTLSNMLNGCYSLKSVPNFNITASCTDLLNLCNNCWSLERAPTFSDSSGVTNITSMLRYCKSLTTVPSYVFGDVTGTLFNATFEYCDSLQVLPSITVGSLYTANPNIIAKNYSLKRMLMPLRFTFSVENAKMSASALNEMFSILPTVTGQTVTITGNYGASTCDTTIATAKGWTVVR